MKQIGRGMCQAQAKQKKQIDFGYAESSIFQIVDAVIFAVLIFCLPQ